MRALEKQYRTFPSTAVLYKHGSMHVHSRPRKQGCGEASNRCKRGRYHQIKAIEALTPWGTPNNDHLQKSSLSVHLMTLPCTPCAFGVERAMKLTIHLISLQNCMAFEAVLASMLVSLLLFYLFY